jgi:predicted Zn-dependent peptidase
LEEIGMCEDDPADLCYELAESSLFDPGPYALQILGTKESVQQTDRGKFLSQLARCYSAKRMVIGVSGAFSEAAVLGLIERFCADLPAGEAAVYPPLACKQGIYRRQARFEQTHLMLTVPGTALWHPDRFALQTVLFLLGTGASSRLNQRIREQLGLVYQIDAWAGRFVTGGYLAVSLSLSGENQKTALCETCRIIRDLPGSITQDELDIAKAKLTSALMMNREQPHAQLGAFGHDLLLRGAITEDEALLRGVRSVTLSEAGNAAAQYLDPASFSLTAVGDTQTEAFYEAILKGDES